MLANLRDAGYRIRDKKKNGSPLSHVTFKAPLQEKGIRDVTLGDAHSREQLIVKIAAQTRQAAAPEKPLVAVSPDMAVHVPYFETYEYGSSELAQISDTHKAVKTNDGKIQVVDRPALERKILSHIRIQDREVKYLIDTTELKRILAEQKKPQTTGERKFSKSREAELVAQIQSSFRCLRYTELHNINGYDRIIELYKACRSRYDMTISTYNDGVAMVKSARGLLGLPQKHDLLSEKIERNKKDIGYILEQYSEDKKLLTKYEGIIKRAGIDTPQGLQNCTKKLEKLESRLSHVHGKIDATALQMKELTNCMRTFERMDRKSGKKENPAVREFEEVSGVSIVPSLAEPQKEPRKAYRNRDER